MVFRDLSQNRGADFVHTKQDPAVIARSTRAIFGDSLDIALLQPVIDVGARYGLLKRTFPATEILAQ